MDRYEMGRLGEEAACRYMEGLGYVIVGRNIHVGHSEFDIICTDDKYILFVEVKTRKMSPDHIGKFGRPRAAVNKQKQEFLMRGVSKYLRDNGILDVLWARIDVIEIYASDKPEFTVRKLTHIKGGIERSPDTLPYYPKN